MDFAVFLVGDGVGVDLGDNGESIKDFEGVVFGRPQHLELVVEDRSPEALGLIHASLGVEGEGVLEIHHLEKRQTRHKGDGANHLIVYDIGLDAFGHFPDGATRTGRVPVAHLKRFGAKVVASHIEIGSETRGGNHSYLAAVGFEGSALLGSDLGVRDSKQIYLMTFRKFHNLVIGAEFVTFLERIGKSGQNN